MLTELTIKEFINKVLSNDPVPGGGSVSALNGALATSLAAMVANLTIGRKKYVEVNEIMEDLSVRFEELTRQLITDVDRDSEAYDRVFSAFKLPIIIIADIGVFSSWEIVEIKVVFAISFSLNSVTFFNKITSPTYLLSSPVCLLTLIGMYST